MTDQRSLLVALSVLLAATGCAPQHTAAPTPPSPVASSPTAPAPTAAADTSAATGAGTLSLPGADPFPSTYRPYPSRPTVIRNATILTAAGPVLRGASILLRDGKIVALGTDVTAPADAVVIDGAGKYVTPGIIDPHSHLGLPGAPTETTSDEGNEATNPATPNVWVEHSERPQDPDFPRALAAGVTTIQILPGSANLFGGRSIVLKVVPSRTVRGMKFPGAKYGMKMACGENPERVYRGKGPETRMGNVAGYRAQFIKAAVYRRKWDRWLADHKGDPPDRDLGLETVADVLRGNIYVHWHCYTVQDMEEAMEMAHEFGFKIRAFHHAVEAYKITDLLKAEGIGAVEWGDFGGFKMEAIDAVRGNLALTWAGGVRTIVHSDEPSEMQRLPQDAAKSMAEAKSLGIDVSEEEAIKWLTLNPAWALGLDDRIGSLEAGKNADVVLWSGSPFSIYTLPEKVWVDGAMLFDRLDPQQRWRTDFELGFVPVPAGGR